jgi:nucleoside-diphosphate-sugar epimerase
MSKRILITGGAGFIGSHLADRLLENGYRVRALDNLSPQVHGPSQQRPDYLSEEVELIIGDVRDAQTVRRSLAGVDSVVHLAAAVGVGQSMYQIAEYVSQNNMGTAALLEALSNRPVDRLVVASSMSIYGEGLYRNSDGNVVPGQDRTVEQLRDHIGLENPPMSPVRINLRSSPAAAVSSAPTWPIASCPAAKAFSFTTTSRAQVWNEIYHGCDSVTAACYASKQRMYSTHMCCEWR